MRLDPLSRRSVAIAVATAFAHPSARPAVAADAPQITDRVRLTVSIGSAPGRDLVIGLYGTEAPSAVRNFLGLSAGSIDGMPSYSGSMVSKVVKDTYILAGRPAAGDTRSVEQSIDSYGYVRKSFVDRAQDLRNSDENSLLHDRAGLVSVPRGGGAFEFMLTPAANLELDRDRLVIGEVMEGQDVLAALNELPTRKPSQQSELSGLASLYGLKAGVGLGVIGVIGRVPGLKGVGGFGFSAGRAALGLTAAALVGGEDPRIKARELNDRPLSKVRIVRARVL